MVLKSVDYIDMILMGGRAKAVVKLHMATLVSVRLFYCDFNKRI
jgi:hypothetical protein